MKFLVTTCFFSLAMAVPRPGFRYAYTIPLEEQAWSQFNERTGSNFAWGYEFPGRAHYESKDEAGNVRGSFGFVDANGSPNVWKYSSGPKVGFNVDVGISENLSQMRSEDQPAEEVPVPVLYYADENKPKREEILDSFKISPLLKSAALSNKVFAAGSSPSSGTPQFYVDHSQVEEAGSVSALAERFGAIPVAAVHDVQARPSYSSQSANSPVLNFSDNLFTIEAPAAVEV